MCGNTIHLLTGACLIFFRFMHLSSLDQDIASIFLLRPSQVNTRFLPHLEVL